MKTLRLRHSILEKSIPEIAGKSIYEIEKMKMKRKEREEIISNFAEYLAHDLYFKSFVTLPTGSKFVKKYYSSEEAFLYEIFNVAKALNHGFVFVYISDHGEPRIKASEGTECLKFIPKLALDVSEHAYFLDYRFEKEKYLKNALSHLDLSLLTSDKIK
jgi:superoxide dismutase